MIRKQTNTIEDETQDFVWVVLLNHKESKIWRGCNEFHLFEDCENARKWATKECHRLLYNIVSSLDVMPNNSSVKWVNDYEIEMTICNKDNAIQDQVNVTIYKKNIL